MTDNFDSLFKDGLEKVKPGTEMMQQDWEAMKSLLLAAPAHNGKLNGHILGKKIFIAVSVASIVLVAAYLLLPAKKTAYQTAATNSARATIMPPLQPPQPKNTNTGLLPTTGNITKHKQSSNPKAHFAPVDTAQLTGVAQQDSATGVVVDIPVAKQKTDAEKLDSFYNLLKTPTQTFVIDNTKDTTIVGKDSGEISIPAKCVVTENGTFPNGKITFLIDECYSYSDIVARKLFTLSDSSLLESGGMLRIRAIAQNKDLKLAKGKNISVAMPTKKYNSQMQLFQPSRSPNSNSMVNINWALADQTNLFYDKPGIEPYRSKKRSWLSLFPWFFWPKKRYEQTSLSDARRGFVKVLNLQNNPYKLLVGGNKIIGKFRVTKNCPLNKEQITTELKKRYSEYSEVIVTFTSEPHSYYYEQTLSNRVHPVIGDSIEVKPEKADRLKLWSPEEKAQYQKIYAKQLKVDSAYYALVGDRSNKYFFTISKLGWINCDHFYNDPRPKVRYVINLKDTAAFYISQLIFLNCRLMMPAQTSGDYVSFPNLPEGEPVQLVSIGIKNGKVVASVQKFTVSKDVVNNIVYQEIGAEDLKKQLRLSDIK